MAWENIVAQLDDEEDSRSKPYRDNSKKIGFEGKPGKLSIGRGRNLDDVGLSKDEIEYLFKNDWNRASDALLNHLPWLKYIDEVRAAVLIDMTFNMGIDGLMKFVNTLACVRAGRYADAATGMRHSLWDEQVGRRAEKLARQMETGVWQTPCKK